MAEPLNRVPEIPAMSRFLALCRVRSVPSKTVVIHAGDLPDIL